MQKTPKNLNELREQLLEAFDSVRTDPRRANQVKEMANAAGKIAQLTKLQLEYSYLRGQQPNIPFIGEDSGVALKPGVKMLDVKSS